MEKEILARFQQKHDIEANWQNATDFIPKAGEIIVYDTDDTHDQPRIKIGNGVDNVNVLTFIGKDFDILPIDRGGTGNADGYVRAGAKAGTTVGAGATAEGSDTEASGSVSHAEGRLSRATGIQSHAEGHNTLASGLISHAEGKSTVASGENSHAEGYACEASGAWSHAEGYNSKATAVRTHAEGYNTTASFEGAHAEGQYTISSGASSHAEGVSTVSSGGGSHSEGNKTKATGYANHAEGSYSIAEGGAAHAEGGHYKQFSEDGTLLEMGGSGTKASGHSSHAEGSSTVSQGKYSHAEGYGTLARGEASHAAGSGELQQCGTGTGASGSNIFNFASAPSKTISAGDHLVFVQPDGMSRERNVVSKISNTQYEIDDDLDNNITYTVYKLTYTVAMGKVSRSVGLATIATGDYSSAEGHKTTASGIYSHAEGRNTTASNHASHAEGDATKATSYYSHAEGYGTIASGTAAHAEGDSTTASGKYSHAEGSNTNATGNYSHAEGYNTIASGNYSHSEGGNTKASGKYSHAEGYGTTASKDYSHAEGDYTTASGDCSHAEGRKSIASGLASHAEGCETQAIGEKSHAEGQSTNASGPASHAEGCMSLIKGERHKSGEVTSSSILKFLTDQDFPEVKINSPYLVYLGDVFIGLVTITSLYSSGSSYGVSYKNYYYKSNYTLQIGNTYDFYATAASGALGKASHTEGLNASAYGEASHAEGCQGGLGGTYLGDGWFNSYSNTFESYGYNVFLDPETYIYSADFPPIDRVLTLSEDGVTLSDVQIRLTAVIGSYSPPHGEYPFQEYEYELVSGSLRNGSYYFYIDPVITQGPVALGKASHAEGISTYANANGCHAEGKFNIEDTSKQYIHITGIGSAQNRANGFTINMQGKGSFASTVATNGADYAEHFEWLDGNPNNEDRIGYMVTLEGDKIKFANEEDDVIGIISGTAAILGDNAEWEWKQKYVTDDFGRIVYEHIPVYEYTEDEETHKIIATKIDEEIRPKLSPEYDPEQPYIARSDRPEWGVVGMFGKLYVRDDGTSLPNQYLKVGNGGIGVNSTSKTNMRVLRRVSENIVQILFT